MNWRLMTLFILITKIESLSRAVASGAGQGAGGGGNWARSPQRFDKVTKKLLIIRITINTASLFKMFLATALLVQFKYSLFK